MEFLLLDILPLQMKYI